MAEKHDGKPMIVRVPQKLSIREVLNRRADLSTFVVHLTRDTGGQAADLNLVSIISEQRLKAGSRMGWASQVADDSGDPDKRTQRAVSFTETPLEHIYSHFAPIEGRHLQFKPYGVAFTKMQARSLLVNPVLYVGSTWGKSWKLATALDELRSAAIKVGFHDSPIADVLPFCEPMFTFPATKDREASQNEWWWEREWRHVGDLAFRYCEAAFWLCPEDEIPMFEEVVSKYHAKDPECREAPPARCIDPRWGLEQIIARLGGLPPEAISPFSER